MGQKNKLFILLCLLLIQQMVSGQSALEMASESNRQNRRAYEVPDHISNESNQKQKDEDSIKTPSTYHSFLINTKKLKDSLLNGDSLIISWCFPYLSSNHKKPFVDEDNFEAFTPPEGSIRRPPPRNNLLIFIAVINIMFIVAIIKISSEREILSLVNDVMGVKSKISSLKFANQQKSVANRVNLQLLAISVMILSLGYFLYGDISFLNSDMTPFIKLISLITLLFVLYFIKMLIHTFMQYLLDVNKLAIHILNNTLVINFLVLLLTFPLFLINYLNFGLISPDQMTLILIIIFIISLIYRVLRETQAIMPSFPYPKMYLLLYLCGFEIIPWLLVYTYLTK